MEPADFGLGAIAGFLFAIAVDAGRRVVGDRIQASLERVFFIKVTAHIAVLQPGYATAVVTGTDKPGVFGPERVWMVRVVNESSGRAVQIKSVWFMTDPPMPVINSGRPLPTLLNAGEMWETWIPVRGVRAEEASAAFLARVRLSTGQLYRALPTDPRDLAPGLGEAGGNH